MEHIDLVLTVLGLVFFGLATFAQPVSPKFNLIAAGLFCVTLTLVV